jgi:hypothetical protein
VEIFFLGIPGIVEISFFLTESQYKEEDKQGFMQFHLPKNWLAVKYKKQVLNLLH